ncbi:MAG TPA: molybdopterin biosynthesis protein, partial [Armatimonadetes bacterium]|nr:molybdopterin biosynthesis protein [Armatimonadota bacterium]
APGNPQGITSLTDLVEKDLTFINRQRGSGTRMLLDYELRRLGVEPERIGGYEREVYTHLAVAAAVAEGAADAGLGILAAAQALGLDFVPVAEERYDLAIRADMLDTPLLQALLAIIRDPSFQRRAEALGGYDLRERGKVLTDG